MKAALRLKIASSTLKRVGQIFLVIAALFTFLGAGDENARFDDLGHRLMCVCGCGQILLECNHVGCSYSDRMRGELMTALDQGNNDSLTLQSMVQKYGTTVLAAPTKSGFNRIAWLMPNLLLTLGLIGMVFLVRNWRNRPQSRLAIAKEGTATSRNHTAAMNPEKNTFREQARRETEL